MSVEDLMDGIAELDDARPEYRQAQRMYDGTVPEVFASSRIRARLDAEGVDFRLNFARTPVDAVIDRLEIAAITADDDEANQAITDVWNANQLDLEAPDIHRKACSLGDAYVIALPIEDDDGTVSGIEIHYNSPLTVRAIYSAENPREVDYYIKRWCQRTSLGDVQRAELYYLDGTIERWTTKVGSKGEQAQEWGHWLAAPDEGEAEDKESWRYDTGWGEPPVFHFRTDRPYGAPEHRGAYGPQNAINKLSATHMGTVDYQGFPQRWALTEAATTDTGDLDPGDWDDLDDSPADEGDPSSLKAGPGELLTLRGIRATGQYEAAKPDIFLDPITFYIRAMAQITTTPVTMFDDQTGQEISGESRRQKDAQFVKKIRNRQLSFGGTWRHLFTFVLKRLGFEAAVVDVRWAPPATVEDKTGWETTALKIANGVPRRQALLEAGYRDEQVDEWLSDVDEAELARRVAVLAALADSAQKLSAAAALGVVTTDQVQSLLGDVFADVENLGPAGELEASDA
ncbi:SPP1 Gp6-like portal protein [Streptomyces sp. Amel2xB2]|uniref:phage portal protein n=1 Tax=Streptomyces sp. Amel2xB2 TaxID=1305829 RepID=UPI000DBF8D1B|nr:phage portal protein [Streptomyces sp. Amel2xB2]RAJ70272.1 SPP1 Gp6-like portal protein [Streptomyces sp. Amel2xB2]